jgi:hypothetical protein
MAHSLLPRIRLNCENYTIPREDTLGIALASLRLSLRFWKGIPPNRIRLRDGQFDVDPMGPVNHPCFGFGDVVFDGYTKDSVTQADVMIGLRDGEENGCPDE